MSPVNLIWVTYKDSMNITYFGAIHKKVTFQEGTSTNSQVTKNKNKSKPKAVEKEASTKNVPMRSSKRKLLIRQSRKVLWKILLKRFFLQNLKDYDESQIPRRSS